MRALEREAPRAAATAGRGPAGTMPEGVPGGHWPAGHELVVLDEVDSTMAEASRRAAGLRGPLWIMARRQLAGRGRRGRPWLAPEGNLATTLIMPLADPPEAAALRSFVAALALREALVAVSGRPEGFAFKWPNDVLLNGGKLAGILLERFGRAGPLAVGFGVNLVGAPPPDALEAGALPAIDLLSATGALVTPEGLIGPLAAAWSRWEARFVAEGFAPVRAAWLAGASRLGEPIRARVGRRDWHGIFETVDLAGNLVLKTADRRLALPAAEVFF